MKIFDGALPTLERALDVRSAKHNALTGNLANVDTPDYAPEDVDFDAAMRAADDEGPPLDVEMFTVPGEGGSPTLNGNTVDLDRTMAGLAENAVQYGAATRAAAKKLAILRYVVSDGLG